MTIEPSELSEFFAQESLGGPENAVGFVLWRVLHRFQRAVDRSLAPLDLTHLQFTTLAMAGWLCRTGEIVTQAKLARRAEIHAMQVSLMLKALEAKGMISRPRLTSDTRTKRIEITPIGLKALRAAMPVVIAIQHRMFGEAGAPHGSLLTELHQVETIAAADELCCGTMRTSPVRAHHRRKKPARQRRIPEP
ncbi:MAG: MarR family transcriptional regulator [Silvibacterium sp.]|nr:MarR family transcriptional regulator [Silvibacterium sp.]